MTYQITKPGMHPDCSPADYHAEPCPTPALTASGIQIILENSMRHFYLWHPALGGKGRNAAEEYTRERVIGQVAHRLALGKGDDYFVVDFDDWRTKEARETREAAAKLGKVAILNKDFRRARGIAEAISKELWVVQKYKASHTELVIAWEEVVGSNRVWCRAMIDAYDADNSVAFDLKSCKQATDRHLSRCMANGYAIQAAWYTRGLRKLGLIGEDPEEALQFLFVETEPPHATRLASLTPGYLEVAGKQCDRALKRFANCLRHDLWPDYFPFVAEPPGWLFADALEEDDDVHGA